MGSHTISRLVCLAGAAIAALLLLGAARVRPAPEGFGTHLQFGLPACAFRGLFGIPCPGCGMTTAFALAIRGRFADAALVQPAGLLLFCALVILVPILLYRGLRPLPLNRLFDVDRAFRTISVVLLIYGGGWIWTVARSW